MLTISTELQKLHRQRQRHLETIAALLNDLDRIQTEEEILLDSFQEQKVSENDTLEDDYNKQLV